MNATRCLGLTRQGYALALASYAKTPTLSPVLATGCSSDLFRTEASRISENVHALHRHDASAQMITLRSVPQTNIGMNSTTDRFTWAIGHESSCISGDVLQIISDELPTLPHSIATMEMSSTLKKRRLKMNKHKYRKRRKRDRRRTK